MKNFIQPLKILSACGIIFTFIFAIWFVDDRYISAEEMSQEKKKIYLKITIGEYRILTKQYYDYVGLVKANPESKELKDGLKGIKTERDKIKTKIDNMLENGK